MTTPPDPRDEASSYEVVRDLQREALDAHNVNEPTCTCTWKVQELNCPVHAANDDPDALRKRAARLVALLEDEIRQSDENGGHDKDPVTITIADNREESDDGD